MKKILLLLSLALTLGYVHAQAVVSENDLPEKVAKKFKKLYSTVKDANWAMAEDDYKAEFEVNKAHYSITISEKGEIIEKKEPIAVASLPATIPPYMAKNHKGFKLKESFKISSDKEATTYEVHGKNKTDEVVVIFDAKGKFVKDKD